jgi:hypothetical protein
LISALITAIRSAVAISSEDLTINGRCGGVMRSDWRGGRRAEQLAV